MVLVLWLPELLLHVIGGRRYLALSFLCLTQCCAFAYLLCVPIVFLKGKKLSTVLKWIFAVLAVGWSIFDVGTYVTTGDILIPKTVFLIFETDVHEASGFFKTYLTAGKILEFIGIFIVFTACVYGFTELWRHLARYRVADVLISGVLLLMIACGAAVYGQTLRVLSFNEYGPLLIWTGNPATISKFCRQDQLSQADPFTRGVWSFKYASLLRKNAREWRRLQEDVWNRIPATQSSEDFNIGVIIGESYIRNHAQIYGYYLPTTPRLQAEKDVGRLVTFQDVISPANFTTVSLRNVMNLNRLSDGESWSDGIYFPLLVKKAGWDVCHYDNQTVSGSNDIGLNQIFYTDLNLGKIYSQVSDTTFVFDHDYLQYLASEKEPNERSGKKLVIYHLQGQHFPYGDKYPHPGVFTVDDITVDKPWLNDERRQQVAEYDNATHYNDSVVGAILDRWRDKPTVVFYFGDHGEDVWDLGVTAARNLVDKDNPQWLDRQFHIPFMIWMSDKFLQDFPEKAAAIRDAADREKGTIDLLGYMILGLCNPSSEYYRADRDLLNQGYAPKERITAEGYEYDRVMSRTAAIDR